MRLILARHGETRLNSEGRFQGMDDEPLNAAGRSQALALARALAGETPFRLYTSPTPRALETARTISEGLGVVLTPVKGLEELHIGQLAGLDGAEMRQRFPDFARSWAENPATARLPGGETMEELQERAWRAITDIWERHPNETVVVVSHNFTILSIIARALEMELRHFRRLRQDLCGISRIELNGARIQALSLNDTSHLRQITEP